MAIFKINVGQKRVIDLIKSPASEIMVASGSRSGKTFIIIWCIVTIALKFPKSRHLIARKHFAHVKGSVWLDTLPKVLEICYPELKGLVRFNNTDFYCVLPNGSEIHLAGLDDSERVDKILGKEYLTIFYNECSEISYDAYTTVKSRLAQMCSFIKPDGTIVYAKNKIFLDQNPTSSKHWTKVLFIDKVDPSPDSRKKVTNPERYAFTQIHPSENSENISADYLEMLENMPPAKKKRFLDGTFNDGSENALWNNDIIAKSRVAVAPRLKRVVVAIDPAVSVTDDSDETGISVKGLGYDNHTYTLDDRTGIYTPNEWAELAIDLYHDYNASLIVGEVNNGGDLIETVIRQFSKTVPYEKIHALRDKYSRAEPVAQLMWMKEPRDHIVGELPDLEEEMVNWEGKKGEKSPNRIDAKVWATYALLPEMLKGNKVAGGSFVDSLKKGGSFF